MKWVEVWMGNIEAMGFVLGSKSEEGGVVWVPAKPKLVGRCEATERAVAQLAGVNEEIAARALARPGDFVFIRAKTASGARVNLYLVVYPTRKHESENERH